MVELVDTQRSGRCARKGVGVRLPSAAWSRLAGPGIAAGAHRPRWPTLLECLAAGGAKPPPGGVLGVRANLQPAEGYRIAGWPRPGRGGDSVYTLGIEIRRLASPSAGQRFCVHPGYRDSPADPVRCPAAILCTKPPRGHPLRRRNTGGRAPVGERRRASAGGPARSERGYVPALNHARRVLMAELGDARSGKREALPCTGLHADPASGQHPQDVAVRKQDRG